MPLPPLQLTIRVTAAATLLALAAMALPPLEARVKAGCLYNFAKFVEWPAGTFRTAKEPLVIGIVGEDPLVPVLAELVAGVRVGGRSVQVRRCRAGADAPRCQILFIGRNQPEPLPALLAAVRGMPVLTVSEAAGFVQAGGMIQLTRQDGRLRFVIQAGVAGQARLKISSQLLKLASSVLHEEPGKTAN